jgi:hypothetical protein
MVLLLYLNKIQKNKSHNKVIQVGVSAMTMILRQLLDQNRRTIMAGTMILLIMSNLDNNNLVVVQGVVQAEEEIVIMTIRGTMVVATLEAEVAEIIM